MITQPHTFWKRDSIQYNLILNITQATLTSVASSSPQFSKREKMCSAKNNDQKGKYIKKDIFSFSNRKPFENRHQNCIFSAVFLLFPWWHWINSMCMICNPRSAISQLFQEDGLMHFLSAKNCDILPHIVLLHIRICALEILFSSNHNIHKSSCDTCFWASDPLIDRFY